MDGWRDRWRVVVASDVDGRDGLGWEVRDPGGGLVWEVFREDGGAFPVLSAVAGAGPLPPRADLEAITREAVADLLTAAGLADPAGWVTHDIAAALLLASVTIETWEGEEWAVDSGPQDAALAWAPPGAARTPYAWLRAATTTGDETVGVYQDDDVFGLCFLPGPVAPALPAHDVGSLRSRRGIELVRGAIRRVEVAYDTTVEGRWAAGLVTEVLLHGESGSTLLVAAEAYPRDEWHLHDESVVALDGLDAADALTWVPPRRSWRSTAGDATQA